MLVDVHVVRVFDGRRRRSRLGAPVSSVCRCWVPELACYLFCLSFAAVFLFALHVCWCSLVIVVGCLFGLLFGLRGVVFKILQTMNTVSHPDQPTHMCVTRHLETWDGENLNSRPRDSQSHTQRTPSQIPTSKIVFVRKPPEYSREIEVTWCNNMTNTLAQRVSCSTTSKASVCLKCSNAYSTPRTSLSLDDSFFSGCDSLLLAYHHWCLPVFHLLCDKQSAELKRAQRDDLLLKSIREALETARERQRITSWTIKVSCGTRHGVKHML